MLSILGKSTSINVRKVLWLCSELGISYKHEQWGAGFLPTGVPEFVALNPNAMVPVMLDDDFVLWESNTICRYLAMREQRFDLLPAAPKTHARVEQWMDWQATELNNSWRYAFMSLVRNSPQHADTALVDASVRNWNWHMEILDRQLARSGAYVTGDDFTLADIVLGLATHRWYSTPMERPDLTEVAAYYERLSGRSGFRLYGRNGMP